MIAVESSNVEAVGFEMAEGAGLHDGILSVKFKGGKVYRYAEVPKVFFEKLMQINDAIKQGRRFESIGRTLQIVTKAPDMFPILDVDGQPYKRVGK